MQSLSFLRGKKNLKQKLAIYFINLRSRNISHQDTLKGIKQ